MLTQQKLDAALSEPRPPGQRLGAYLVQQGLVSETQLTQILGQQLSVPWVSLYHIDFSRQLLNLVPRDVAEKIAERLRKSVAGKRFNASAEAGLNITISVGVASLKETDTRVEDLLKRADLALYQAKRAGRNRVVLAAA